MDSPYFLAEASVGRRFVGAMMVLDHSRLHRQRGELAGASAVAVGFQGRLCFVAVLLDSDLASSDRLATGHLRYWLVVEPWQLAEESVHFGNHLGGSLVEVAFYLPA
jgi:hypothetical protein